MMFEDERTGVLEMFTNIWVLTDLTHEKSNGATCVPTII